MRVDLRHGDCVDLMRAMPECSVDSIVCDPPYGLEFMGKEWDRLIDDRSQHDHKRPENRGQTASPFIAAKVTYRAGMEAQAWHEAWAREALRVLKPGGHLLAFGGTRTYHRMACAIEDAGFEIRDSIHWVYGSGFPKSLNVGKAIDKRGGSVPGFERFRDDVKTAMKRNGVSRSTVQDALGNFMLSHYLTAGSQPAVPNLRDYIIIRDTVGLGEKWDEQFLPEAEREVVGKTTSTYGYQQDGERWDKDHFLTAPATDEARRWEGWGTALKPAHEPVVVARKPLQGTVAGNVLAWGTGGLNIDGCRVGTDDTRSKTGSSALGIMNDDGWKPKDVIGGSAQGRWPANIVLDGAAAAALDQQSGPAGSNSTTPGTRAASDVFGGWGRQGGDTHDTRASGGASRFFTQADFGPDDWPFVYQAKPSKRERNAGLDGLPERPASERYETISTLNADHQQRLPAANHHPTVKPVALMRHLVRLVTPPGGTVLDPFAGSGTTLVAAVLEGMNAIGCEMTDEYLPIIEGRVAWAEEQAESAANAAANPEQPTLL